ncbi:YHYH protein [Algibacter sp. L4_22]|uniref:YHYH protein n=1 Tax=Algibacter sp. L4_22 TaxID=2942477 RepID=UPI00201B90D6|nr:YHYH protein [Algibacter sp. L4_22]MCL5128021.1 YHYH protein [Algibacter sp. L4_22]
MNYKIILMISISAIFYSCHAQKSNINSEEKPTETNTDYFGNYTLNNKTFGTKTSVVIDGDYRIITTNALPNHETGEYPRKGNPNKISAQNKTYKIPLKPIFTGIAKWAREPGVALNGVKFEPETAEMVICDSGENFKVEAVQDLIDLGLDFNNAHVQPTGEYHYHGIAEGLVEAFDSSEDLVHLGFAKDGFPIYYSKSGIYKPSYQIINGTYSATDCTYSNPKTSIDVELDGDEFDGTFVSDWEFVKGKGDLDECNGIYLNGTYMYIITDTYPYVGRCLMGEFEEERHPGPPPGREGRGQRPPRNR